MTPTQRFFHMVSPKQLFLNFGKFSATYICKSFPNKVSDFQSLGGNFSKNDVFDTNIYIDLTFNSKDDGVLQYNYSWHFKKQQQIAMNLGKIHEK